MHLYILIIYVNGVDRLNQIGVKYNKFINTDSSETTCICIMLVFQYYNYRFRNKLTVANGKQLLNRLNLNVKPWHLKVTEKILLRITCDIYGVFFTKKMCTSKRYEFILTNVNHIYTKLNQKLLNEVMKEDIWLPPILLYMTMWSLELGIYFHRKLNVIN